MRVRTLDLGDSLHPPDVKSDVNVLCGVVSHRLHIDWVVDGEVGEWPVVLVEQLAVVQMTLGEVLDLVGLREGRSIVENSEYVHHFISDLWW